MIAGLVFSSASSLAEAATFADGSFADDWSSIVVGTGTSVATRVTSGGNPNSYFSITNVTDPGEFVYGIYLKTTAVYTPSVEGAIASIDYDEDAKFFLGGGNRQAAGMALRQNGVVYILNTPAFTNSADWGPLMSSVLTPPPLPLTFAGLDAEDFSTITDASLHPDFSVNGGAITFGFFRANGSSNTRIAGIDNWFVRVNTVAAPIPLPATIYAQLAGVALLWHRRRVSRAG
ncbi:MAG: hypothetical protein K2Y51_21905 [Gammaproteobacteria bacterium]|nr:hypothetical protein [Gammaproteobacteria bacterium]